MAELATLARPYAGAVFDLAKTTNSLDTWSNNLKFLEIVVQDDQINNIIHNPKIDKNTISNLLLDICSEQLDQVGINLLKVLLENKRLAVIPQLVAQYELLKAHNQGFLKVEIAASYPVEQAQQETIKTILQKRLGKTIDINITLDESLLAGCLIHAGDDVIDLSVKGRLQQLATELRR
ncbi:MAG: F0F1 ATP synthase subunit delta [Thiomargarita sp.]|nr:F0F1 ATP synthase subunit delta [Thiomargarita sp.]